MFSSHEDNWDVVVKDGKDVGRINLYTGVFQKFIPTEKGDSEPSSSPESRNITLPLAAGAAAVNLAEAAQE